MLQLFRNGSTFPFPTTSINRLDALFNSLAGDDGAFVAQTESRFGVAMWQDEDHIHIEADLPGVAEEDVEVTVHRDQLLIRGDRKAEEGRTYLYNGRRAGRFERAFALPEAINTNDVVATLKNGVLYVDFPKAAEARPKKINLKTS
jgi:HSP20 family protein